MNQSIGIEFYAKGQDKVVKSLRTINKSLGTLLATVKSINDRSLTIKMANFMPGLGEKVKEIRAAADAMRDLNTQLRASGLRMPRTRSVSAVAAAGKNTKEKPAILMVDPDTKKVKEIKSGATHYPMSPKLTYLDAESGKKIRHSAARRDWIIAHNAIAAAAVKKAGTKAAQESGFQSKTRQQWVKDQTDTANLARHMKRTAAARDWLESGISKPTSSPAKMAAAFEKGLPHADREAYRNQRRSSGKKESPGPQSTHRANKSFLPFELQAIPFALRWGLTAGAIYGTGSLFKDVVMGGARTEMMDELRDLGVIEFSRDLIYKMEEWGNKFVDKFWVGGPVEGFYKAAANIGSSFDIQDKKYFGTPERGAEMLKGMAEHSMVLGAASKMNDEAASSLLASSVQARLAYMKPSDKEKYESGEKSLEKLSESTATTLAKVIQYTATWGNELGLGMSYAMAGALQKGMSFETIAAFIGAMVTTGIKGQKAGLAMRDLQEKGVVGMSQLLFAGSEDEGIAQQFAGLKPQQQKMLGKRLAPLMDKMFATDPIGTFQMMGKYLERAEDPKRGFRASDFVNKYFIQVFRTATSEKWAKDTKELIQKIWAEEGIEGIRKLAEENAADVGYIIPRLSHAWSSLKKQWAKVIGMSPNMQNMFENLVTSLQKIRGWIVGDVSASDAWASVSNWGDSFGKLIFESVMPKVKDAVNYVWRSIFDQDLITWNVSDWGEYKQGIQEWVGIAKNKLVGIKDEVLRVATAITDGMEQLRKSMREIEAIILAHKNAWNMTFEKNLFDENTPSRTWAEMSKKATELPFNAPKRNLSIINKLYDYLFGQTPTTPPGSKQTPGTTPDTKVPLTLNNYNKTDVFVDGQKVASSMAEHQTTQEIQAGHSFGNHLDFGYA